MCAVCLRTNADQAKMTPRLKQPQVCSSTCIAILNWSFSHGAIPMTTRQTMTNSKLWLISLLITTTTNPKNLPRSIQPMVQRMISLMVNWVCPRSVSKWAQVFIKVVLISRAPSGPRTSQRFYVASNSPASHTWMPMAPKSNSLPSQLLPSIPTCRWRSLYRLTTPSIVSIQAVSHHKTLRPFATALTNQVGFQAQTLKLSRAAMVHPK